MTTSPTLRDVALVVDNSADWAEVRVRGEVVYRGHIDQAHERLLYLLGVEMTAEPVTGPRVQASPAPTINTHACVTCYCEGL